ncbi:PKD domain-containing protein [Halorussus ruber]|uniref:PKD domain-containing protein n=1 Tax=Halorussus ruber TaxID=1126238 RepID=UPI0010921AFE|nr:PKD domain-containing protein [Halorussus ruber]
MTDAKATTVLLVALLVASSFGTATVGAGSLAGDATGNDAAGNDASESAGDTETFHVVQGEECYEVTALGSGEKTVSEFYDYRAGAGTLYGSYGEDSQAVQENQVSHVFVYEGEEGLSLVMLHDDLNETGGGAATFDISGLPEEREWVIEDDDYANRDDNFDHGETSSTIDWMWGDNRTDGAAVRGLDADFEGITVEPAFGEESWAYQNRSNPWPFATDEIEDWQLQSGTGEEFSLDRDEPIKILKGSCGGGEDGSEDEDEHGDENEGEDGHDRDSSAALSVSPETVTENESVQFEASGLAEACEDATYKWDFDSDGDTDARTDDPTVSHTYDDAGSYNATVTIVREDGTEESSSTSVEVTADDQKRVCKPAEEGEPEDGEGEDEESDENEDEERDENEDEESDEDEDEESDEGEDEERDEDEDEESNEGESEDGEGEDSENAESESEGSA